MNKKSFAAALLACLMLGASAGCSSGANSSSAAPASDAASTSESASQTSSGAPAADAITLKIAVGIPQSHKDIGNKFKEVVEKETNGAIVVNVFADNALGADREVLEAVQMGDIDITLSSVTPLAATYHDLYLFDTPFMITSREKAYKLLDGEVGQTIAKGLESKNLKVLSFPENGFRNLTTSNREVHTPADLKGLKVRVMENEIQIATWQALGVNPTPMAFTEVFTALQQGTIDGQENPIELIYQNKINEVQKYLIMTQHMYNPLVLAMNNEKFGGLSPEYQTAIMKAAKEATDYERQTAPKYEQECLDKIINEDASTQVIELTDEERAQFQKAVESVSDVVRKSMEHPELLDRAIEILAE